MASPSKYSQPPHCSLRSAVNSLDVLKHHVVRGLAACSAWASDGEFHFIVPELTQLRPHITKELGILQNTLKGTVKEVSNMHNENQQLRKKLEAMQRHVDKLEHDLMDIKAADLTLSHALDEAELKEADKPTPESDKLDFNQAMAIIEDEQVVASPSKGTEHGDAQRQNKRPRTQTSSDSQEMFDD